MIKKIPVDYHFKLFGITIFTFSRDAVYLVPIAESKNDAPRSKAEKTISANRMKEGFASNKSAHKVELRFQA